MRVAFFFFERGPLGRGGGADLARLLESAIRLVSSCWLPQPTRRPLRSVSWPAKPTAGFTTAELSTTKVS